MRLPFRLPITLLLLVSFALAACDSNDGGADAPPPREVAPSDYITTESGLKYYDFVEGSGADADPGQNVRVHYRGWLTDETLFDNSYQRGRPLAFQLGSGQVIAGWDEGIAGMRIGGERQLVIPPELGYGASGSGDDIPPNATLIFEVELVDVN